MRSSPVLLSPSSLYSTLFSANDGVWFGQVTPENEFDPVWEAWNPAYVSPPAAYTISEDVAVGTTVVTMTASDADSAANGDGLVTYTLVSSNPGRPIR